MVTDHLFGAQRAPVPLEDKTMKRLIGLVVLLGSSLVILQPAMAFGELYLGVRTHHRHHYRRHHHTVVVYR